MSAKKKGLNDRERILLRIIEGLSATQLLAPVGSRLWAEDFNDKSLISYVHFAYWKEPMPGDLVMGKTGGFHEWKVGFYVAPLPPHVGGATIREIGTGALCDYTNESFVPIVGLSKIDLLEGDRYEVYQKVLMAFRRGDEYRYRFGGIDFDGDEILITIREVHGGLGMPSVPFVVRVKWNRRTSIAKILADMRASGYGTRSFSPEAAAS